MEVAIQARNVKVPEGVRALVQEKVGRLDRFLDGIERADVRFSEERNPRIAEKEVCEVTIHGRGHIVRAKAAATDAMAAVDLVIDKLEGRMTRLKGRMNQRAGRRAPAAELVTNGNRQGATTLLEAPELEYQEDAGDAGPRIVKAKRFDMKPMTAEEAVLQMELLGHDFFLFSNAETGQTALVYRRADQNIGLIDT